MLMRFSYLGIGDKLKRHKTVVPSCFSFGRSILCELNIFCPVQVSAWEPMQDVAPITMVYDNLNVDGEL